MKDLDQVNFGPLQAMRGVYGQALLGTSRRKASLITVIIITIITCLVVRSGVPAISVVIAYFWWVSIQAGKAQAIIWRDFAEKNGWEVSPASLDLVPPGLRGVGHGGGTSQIVQASFNNLDCQLGEYSFTTGHGKNSHTYTLTLAVVRLAKQLPGIILDSRKNYGGLRGVPNGYKRLKLEGDFDRYFKLYLLKNQEVDALSIITPDVMQTLIRSNQQEDIEIADDKLYFVAVQDKRDPASLKRLLQDVVVLAAPIQHRVKTLRYTPVKQ